MGLLSEFRYAAAGVVSAGIERALPSAREMTGFVEALGRPGEGALPVVIQGGWTSDGYLYEGLARQLRRQGFEVFSTNLPWHGFDHIESDADALSRTIEAAKAATGASRVSVVAHSKGGLSSRYYLQRMGGLENVAQLVTLGTPHFGVLPEGSVAARLAGTFAGKVAPRAGDMVHADTPFLRDLNADFADWMRGAVAERPDFRIVTVTGQAGPLAWDGVVPNWSSQLKKQFQGVPGIYDVKLPGHANDHLSMAFLTKAGMSVLSDTLAGARAATGQVLSSDVLDAAVRGTWLATPPTDYGAGGQAVAAFATSSRS